MEISFDLLRSRMNCSAKTKFLNVDPRAGCLIPSGIPAAEGSLDAGRRHDVRSFREERRKASPASL
jgi:hypothetical protein